MKIGEIVYHWPLFAKEPTGTVVLLEFDADEDADYEEKARRPSWRVVCKGHAYPVWINERDLRQV